MQSAAALPRPYPRQNFCWAETSSRLIEYRFTTGNFNAGPVSCMTSTTADARRMAAAQMHQKEILRYLESFAAAFDELQDAVINQIKTPDQYISPHHDYPVMSRLDSGFPSFRESGFYRDNAPKDYVSTVRPHSLIGLLGGLTPPKREFPRG